MGCEGDEKRGENRRRMKADREQHQLRMTVAGEADRAQRERRETVLEDEGDSLEEWTG